MKQCTYSLVVGVDEDDLVVLVYTVLVHPVRVQDTEVATPPADTLLSNTLETTLGLEVVHTLADVLAVRGTCTKLKTMRDDRYPWSVPLRTCFLRLPRRTRTR